MRLRPLIHIVGLRYRLMWAQARSRVGRIALVVLGFMLVVLVAAFLALGGFGAAVAAVRVGRGELVARIALTAGFLFGVLGSVTPGAGEKPTFSDATLRRYPLSSLERLAGRHVVGLFEPLWVSIFVFDLGLAVGFAVLGASSAWIAVPAALLLISTNYLLARILMGVVEGIMATRNGPLLLVMLITLMFLLPGLLLPPLARNPALRGNVLAVLSFSPPFAASTVLAGASALASVASMLLMLGWCAGLIAALALLERQPLPSRAVPGAEATWDQLYDRIAAPFGPALAPLVGKVLRYYVRSPQLRLNYPTGAAGAVLIAFVFARGQSDPLASFLAMLGAISMVGVLTMGVMTMNVFGFDGAGFRRYFLLPAPPAAVLRAAAIVPLLLGAPLIPISLGLWLAFWRGHFDVRMAIMALSSGFGGMFLFQALGLWTSLRAPRAQEFNVTFGNKPPPATTALMMGGLLVMSGLEGGLPRLGSSVVLGHWWVAPLILLATAGFYLFTLREGARVFSARRERMLSMIERGY